MYPFEDLFKGEKLRLAGIRAEDAEVMAAFTDDYDYMALVDTDFAVPQSVESFGGSKSRSDDMVEFRLRTLEDDALIGFVALHGIEWNNRSANLAIGIGHADSRGRGYGAEALKLILRYAFHELNLNRVSLNVIEYNDRALKAYLKAGFREEGRMRSAVLRGGQSYDLIVMGILQNEWRAQETA